MDVAIFVTHEVQIGQRYGNGLGSNSKETADVDDRLTAGTGAVDMIDLTDLVVVGTIYGRTFQDCWSKFGRGETNVIAVVHDFLLLLMNRENPSEGDLFPKGSRRPLSAHLRSGRYCPPDSRNAGRDLFKK
jgi:hypothetical protein